MKIPLALLAAFILAAPLHSQSTTWPQTATSAVGEVTVYQPQIDTYTGNQFTAHAAVSVTKTSGGEPIFGAIFFTATVATDRGTGTVTVQNLDVTNSRFPTAEQADATAVSQAIDQSAGQWNLTFSQSQLLAQLSLTQKEQAAAADLSTTPPQILFASSPSVLVTIAGEPKLVQATGSDLMTVVNTPFFIALDPATKTYYLQGGGQWLSTADILQGPWAPTASVPQSVLDLAAKQTPPQTGVPATIAGAPPQIIVATQPTELIQTTGPAEYGPIENTDLLYVTNTESDVFMDIDSQTLYVLLSGRWYSAPSQSGPWTYVPGAQLPPDFARIPPGSPVANVLACVPKTQAAQNAVLDAQIPQTAAIQRSAPGPKVAYDGAPKFQPVAKSSAVSYAVNTTHSVVKVKDVYYVCSDGVWYQSVEAVGPWVVSVEIPEVIYTIPPTCPIYPVTYCKIYSVTPDVVYCGYLPGYTGSYVFGGAVVYGTGWNYNPWFGNVFIPQPCTWGFGATFSAGWGCWGFSVGAGWGAASFGCGWNSGWWGVGNYHWNNWNWNSNWNQNVNINRNVTNNYNVNRTVNNTTNNIYRNHPNRLTPNERQRLENNEQHLANQQRHLNEQMQQERDRGTAAANAQREADHEQAERDKAQRDADERRLGQNSDRVPHPSAAPNPEGDRNNVFADRDGNVYRHDGDGWQRHEADGWQRPPSGDDAFDRNRANLNRQFGARARGGDFDRARGGGGYRGGGGGRRR